MGGCRRNPSNSAGATCANPSVTVTVIGTHRPRLKPREVGRRGSSAVTRCSEKVKLVTERGDLGRGSSLAVLRSDDIAHPVCGVGCAPLRQSGGDDREVFAVERADRGNQSEDETCRGELRSTGELPFTYRTRKRVRDHFDRRLQCLEPPLAIASMRPLARMAEDVALDVLFDGG